MVRALGQEQENYEILSRFKGFHSRSLSSETGSRESEPAMEDGSLFRIALKARQDQPSSEKPRLGRGTTRSDRGKSRHSREDSMDASQYIEKLQHDMEQMKERFAKLLLGEDMSGGGKGVSSALALSNAITNLAASAFSEQNRLEPMAAETKARWRKEIDWLLSVTDHIVEFVASRQKSNDGSSMEIMVTRQRNDLHMNIPALRKLDAMLLDCLDNFKDKNEFYYLSKDAPDGAKRNGDKWWLPTVKVPEGGLSEVARKFQLEKQWLPCDVQRAFSLICSLHNRMLGRQSWKVIPEYLKLWPIQSCLESKMYSMPIMSVKIHTVRFYGLGCRARRL